jgi:hypothetical protein
MDAESGSRHTGRKIWYGVAIALCGLVILLSVVGVIGTWVVGSSLSTAITQVLVVVENTASSLSEVVVQVDQGIARFEERVAEIRSATQQLSQNVTDKGLVLTLLPEEREQALVTQANELRQTVQSVVDAINAGLELYRSINQLPFVSLPKLPEDTIAGVEKAVADTQALVQQVTEGIQDFRAGVTQEIARVTAVLDEITARLDNTRQSLAQLNSALLGLKDAAARVREVVPLVFTLVSIFTTLFLIWIIYTQVEVIRGYTRRWKSLGAGADAPPVESLPVAGGGAEALAGAEGAEEAPAAEVTPLVEVTPAVEEAPAADLPATEDDEEITGDLPVLPNDEQPPQSKIGEEDGA